MKNIDHLNNWWSSTNELIYNYDEVLNPNGSYTISFEWI